MAPKRITKTIEKADSDSEPETTILPVKERKAAAGSPAVRVPDMEGDGVAEDSSADIYDVITALSDHGFRVEGEFKNGECSFKFANGPTKPNKKGDVSEHRSYNHGRSRANSFAASLLGYGKPPSYRETGLKYIGYH